MIGVINARGGGGSPSNPKVISCHLPPGNPNNAQTQSAGLIAVPSHLGQHGGDRLESCNATCGLGKGRNEIGEIFT